MVRVICSDLDLICASYGMFRLSRAACCVFKIARETDPHTNHIRLENHFDESEKNEPVQTQSRSSTHTKEDQSVRTPSPSPRRKTFLIYLFQLCEPFVQLSRFKIMSPPLYALHPTEDLSVEHPVKGWGLRQLLII